MVCFASDKSGPNWGYQLLFDISVGTEREGWERSSLLLTYQAHPHPRKSEQKGQMSRYKSHKAWLSFLARILPEQLGPEEKAWRQTMRKQLSPVLSPQALDISPMETHFSCISTFVWTLLQKELMQSKRTDPLETRVLISGMEKRVCQSNHQYSIVLTTIHEQQSWSQLTMGSLIKICSRTDCSQKNRKR